MAQSHADELAALIGRLQDERRQHLLAIEEIDETFSRYGIQPQQNGRRGRSTRRTRSRPPRRGPGRPRGARRHFPASGPESVLQFIRQKGPGGASSSEIVRHWKSEGRAGQPYITLGQMVKSGKLKKQTRKNQRSSQYSIA